MDQIKHRERVTEVFKELGEMAEVFKVTGVNRFSSIFLKVFVLRLRVLATIIEELKRAIQWKRDIKIKNCIMKIIQWIILIELVLFGFFVGAIFLLTSLCSLIILDRVLLKVCEREEESLSEI